jgi:hypothetical protein
LEDLVSKSKPPTITLVGAGSLKGLKPGEAIILNGEVGIADDQWSPEGIVIKIASDRTLKDVHGSYAVSPKAAGPDGRVSFSVDISAPKKNGKYHVVAKVLGGESTVSSDLLEVGVGR